MLISIVIPCYNSEHTIGRVVELTEEVIAGMPGYECEFILVNDSSPDNTFRAICDAAAKHSSVKGIDLAKNFGQHNAIMAGLHYAKGDLIIGMDDDLQTHPSQIPVLVGKIMEGYDVVFGIFGERKFSRMKNFTSSIATFIMWHMVKRPKGIESSNYWIIRKYVRDEVIKYTNPDPYISMLFFRTTSRVGNVQIEHFAREEGTSNYTFRKAFKLFLAFMNFTVLPLRIATILGALFSSIGLILSIIIIVRKILDPSITDGWASLITAMLLLFGFTFLLLGVIGEYVGNIIHTLNSTPQYVIRSRVGISGEADAASPQFANKDSGCYNEMSGENPLIEEVRR